MKPSVGTNRTLILSETLRNGSGEQHGSVLRMDGKCKPMNYSNSYLGLGLGRSDALVSVWAMGQSCSEAVCTEEIESIGGESSGCR